MTGDWKEYAKPPNIYLPSTVKRYQPPKQLQSTRNSTYDRILDRHCIGAGYRSPIHNEMEPGTILEISDEEIKKTMFSKDFIADYESKNPGFKRHDAPYTTKDGETPDYFSEELKIAISTCHALYGPDGTLTPGDGKDHRDEIIKYLFKHHRKSLSKGGFPIRCKVETYLKPDPGKLPAGIDRITTMINLNPNPGRKKSQS